MKYSVVVPVFNRPEEVDELLDSLTRQTMRNFEVVIVEDGSHTPCRQVCDKYTDRLDLKYFMKENSGPGQSRNFGVVRAKGEYVIILDSDVVLPEGYLQAVEDELQREPCDAFGGPDRAHDSFTDTQKAISYSMTSFFTTGGIRGGKKKLDKFYPRSFNMGIRRDVYQTLGGFSKMRFGEDVDFSIRLFEAGYKCRLFPEAWVYHKRRTDFRKFWRQVFNSGIARINLYMRHPESLKVVHLLPMMFTLGMFLLMAMFLFGIFVGVFVGPYVDPPFGLMICTAALLPPVLYSLIIFIDSSICNRSIKIGLLSIHAAFTQLIGYGCGFLDAWWKRCIKDRDEYSAYSKNFYQ
ncbi:MAG: glycosyltransferase [Prevotella sp.]|jgi:glycosyltransferase involved in cell wall biosynthesis